MDRAGLLAGSYLLSNKDLDDSTARGRIGTAFKSVWNHRAFEAVRDAVRSHGAQVAHFHNTFAAMSPSVYYGAQAGGARVVQTVHNYRLSCLNGLFLRSGRPCELCLGSAIKWQGVAYRCYRNDLAASLTVGSMTAAHRLARTYTQKIDRYIALTDFARIRLLREGIPEDRIRLKPNFVFEPPAKPKLADRPEALFVGRLSEEKGIKVLAAAWAAYRGAGKLKVIGDGDLLGILGPMSRSDARIELCGRMSRPQVAQAMGEARVLVLPSICYEGMPMTILEAYASSLPVIAAGIGGLPEIVRHGETGFTFPAGDAAALSGLLRSALDEPRDWDRLRRNARREYELRYTPAASLNRLVEIYEELLFGQRQLP